MRINFVHWLLILCVLNRLNAELNPIRHLLALVGAHHIVHVSRVRVGIDFNLSFCLLNFEVVSNLFGICGHYHSVVWFRTNCESLQLSNKWQDLFSLSQSLTWQTIAEKYTRNIHSSKWVYIRCLTLGDMAKFREIDYCFLISVYPSVRPHGTNRLPLDGFPPNLIFEYF